MWFLRTDRAELVYRPSTEGIVYAILSHVWGPSEQSFQDIRELHQRLASSPENPRSHACEKIRNFCAYAEAAGYDLAWADTCCIDKTSSAELSEAINSMYTWYADADVCYAFLADVPDHDDPELPDSAFRRSKWFTRGWTLQELIAPLDVVFLSVSWKPLCSKSASSGLIQQVTGIDIDVLLSFVQLPSVPAARRLSWAADRETTRIEDEAYSLMGIFGVNIPIVYGEGRRAFTRLQEEIMKQSPDHTIFVWGLSHCVSIDDLLAHAPWTNYPRRAVHSETDPTQQVLFAPSPRAFLGSSNVQRVSIRRLAITAEIGLAAMNNIQPEPSTLNNALRPPHVVPEFTVTSYGVRARLPIIQFCDDDSSIAVAVLACQGPEGSIVGLLLHQQDHPDDIPLYRIGVHCIYHDIGRPYPLYGSARYVRIHLSSRSPPAAPDRTPLFTLRWREVFLVYHTHSFGFAPLRGLSTSVTARPLLAPCRLLFPQWMLARLARVGFTPNRPLSDTSALNAGMVSMTTEGEFEAIFTHAQTQHAFSVRFACCMRPGPVLPNGGNGSLSVRAHAHAPFRPLWIVVDASWPSRHPSSHRDSPTAYTGVQQGIARRCVWCRETHLDYWEELEAQSGRTGRQMEFHFIGKTVRLTISHWDSRARATETEGSGGGLYAVHVEVENCEEGPADHGSSQLEQAEVPKNAALSPETASKRSSRSSSRPNSVRSLLAAVHRQVLGKGKGQHQ
ncbi:heterokaryon incompatibility protein-domain-containing protein [Dichomitus squalens]|uniref:Heterokaryon incompatibility protein-domain-containing protein n=1 Tax=Dichomitus squalens TaxID=114155 RepID=A0A4Q9PL98_9APHY|nr:heterokaryon incompatibility protein-domain-containing protein [Dichomitus squalens]